MYTNLKYKWDNQNVRDYAVETAFKRGYEEGLKLGREEGRLRFLQEKKEIALRMKNADFSIAQIVKFTKLSVEEIEKLSS